MPNGHQNHYWMSVSGAIKEKMQGCAWQIRISRIKRDLDIKFKEVELKIKHLGNIAKARTIKSKIRAV